MNNAVSENIRKRRDIKLVTTERSRNYLVSEPNHHTTKLFPENLVAIEMKKTEILIDQPVSLGLSILELSKILMYESWYDNVKLKKGEKVKWHYMDTDSLIVYIKTEDRYKDVETRIDTSNYESECYSIDKPLPKGKS